MFNIMTIPAQIPNFANKKWKVYISNAAFKELYETYIRNFEQPNRYVREYSVNWFRQFWNVMNQVFANTTSYGLFTQKIYNYHSPSKAPYGEIQFETRPFTDHNTYQTTNVMIIYSFNISIPYRDVYSDKSITIKENNNSTKFMVTESQLRRIIRKSIKKYLNII